MHFRRTSTLNTAPEAQRLVLEFIRVYFHAPWLPFQTLPPDAFPSV